MAATNNNAVKKRCFISDVSTLLIPICNYGEIWQENNNKSM
jgi:hypothetical protein